MASIESRIDTFIAEHELDPMMKDEICVLVTGCMEDLFKQVFSTPVPEGTKAKKVLKADKVEDPATCETIEDLRNCTTGVLNQFCKDHGLKVGGNKKEIMDRVWRHMQGESSDDDKSTRGKPKNEKKAVEKHACFGTNASGADCAISATELFCGHHFCHRHIVDAQKFIDSKKSGPSEPVKPKSVKSKPEKVPESEPVKQKPKSAKAKKVVAPPPPEPESEEEELEEEQLEDGELEEEEM